MSKDRLALDLMILTDKNTLVRGWAIGQMVDCVDNFKCEAIAIDEEVHPHLKGITTLGGRNMMVMYQPGEAWEPLRRLDG